MGSSWSKSKRSAKHSTLPWTGSLVLLLCVVNPFSGAQSQQRDAATVIAEMRQALGGAAALDAIKSFSVTGSRTFTAPGGSRRVALEWFAILPDHFLEVRRDSPPGPVSIDFVDYDGVAGTRVIRKTKASGMEPPEPKYLDNSPQAVAARERAALLRQARVFSRILLILTGTSTPAYPLQIAYAGTEQAEGKTYDVLDVAGPDGMKWRLHVDSATHLPAMLTWLDTIPATTMTTTTMVATTTSVVRVPSGSPPPVMPSPAPLIPPSQPPPSAGPTTGTLRWLFTSFKTQDGITWPRVIEEEFHNRKDEIRLGNVKINPKIDAKKFDVK